MKAILEVIGAFVVTIFILGVPVLSVVSFINNWDDFFQWIFIIVLSVDFIYVFSKLLGETE